MPDDFVTANVTSKKIKEQNIIISTSHHQATPLKS